MTQHASLGKTATILASLGLLSATSFGQDGSLSQDRVAILGGIPSIGGAANGVWFAPVDFEGEMRGVLLNDAMQPEFEIEAMMTQLIALGASKVPDVPAELMEGFLYGDVYRAAVGQAPRELVGWLEGSWQGNQHGAGEFFALMYHLRLSPDVAGFLQGEFRGADAVDGTLINGGPFGAPPPVQVQQHSAQQLPGGLPGVGIGSAHVPPSDDGCSDVTACTGGHSPVDSQRVPAKRPIGSLPNDNQSWGLSVTRIGPQQAAGPSDQSSAGASLVPQDEEPGLFHGRWLLFL